MNITLPACMNKFIQRCDEDERGRLYNVVKALILYLYILPYDSLNPPAFSPSAKS